MLHACKWTDLIQSERYGSFDDQHLLITAGVHNSLQKTKGKHISHDIFIGNVEIVTRIKADPTKDFV